jgi:hypothetical protein
VEFIDELIQAGRVKTKKKRSKVNATHSLAMQEKEDHGLAREEIEEGFC